MADILIQGMEMPKNGERTTITVYGDGVWCAYYDNEPHGKAVLLPAGHGRLIDADAFKAMCISATKEAKPDFIRHEDWLKSCAVTMAFCRDIDERPTIVPAEGGTDDVRCL